MKSKITLIASEKFKYIQSTLKREQTIMQKQMSTTTNK